MKFRCRVAETYIPLRFRGWFEVEADSEIDAAQEAFDKQDWSALTFVRSDADGTRESVRFGVVEVEGWRVALVRSFYRGIGRKGGAVPNDYRNESWPMDRRLADLANHLGPVSDGIDLLSDGWEGEEQEWTR